MLYLRSSMGNKLELLNQDNSFHFHELAPFDFKVIVKFMEVIILHFIDEIFLRSNRFQLHWSTNLF